MQTKQSEEFIFNKITQRDEELVYIFIYTHFTAAYSLWLQAYISHPNDIPSTFSCIMYIVIV